LKFANEEHDAGLGQPSFSNGSSYGDLDNDGDLDLVVNNVNSPAFVYKNECREKLKNNFVAIQLQGEKENTFAIGSKIIIYQGDQIINRELIPTRGFQSSVDYRQIIGLGPNRADSMVIIWPGSRITRIQNPAVNQLHQISITGAKPYENVQQTHAPMLEKVQTAFDTHKEDDYIDFYTERNIPVMLSREGPHADTADVNRDGWTDVFIVGAAGQPGALYLQKKSGFVKQRQPEFEKDRWFEDVAILFFDADNDNDKDLFVGSGGNAQETGNNLLHHRLYVNDGKGNFSSVPEAFPAYAFNCAAAAATDADEDGDLDLFVASRGVPQNYGVIPESYLYVNSGKGKFVVGATVKAGMLTDVAAADLDGDNKNEIIVTGEWTSPKVYSIKNYGLHELNTGLQDYKGWWQSVSVADLDNDGDADCVFGNAGENCYLKPSRENPVKLWINDFDQNGTLDKIITRRINNQDVPLFLKRELTEQMPSLKKQNLKFEDYAKKSIHGLFGNASLKAAQKQEINYLASCIAINNGKGEFALQPLPVYTQLSCINAALCTDLNNDGRIDLIMGGNQFHFQPQFARLDASYGHVLYNNGPGNGMIKWQWAEPSVTGFEIRGEIKDFLLFPTPNGNQLLVLQNDNYPIMFRKAID
jgi:hypothetical protein